jgi:hypothetical protein
MTLVDSPCPNRKSHPLHTWFPHYDFPDNGLLCVGVADLGPWLTGPLSEVAKPKRINADAKGKRYERALVDALKHFGFDDARRTVRTGYRNARTQADDEGDVDGTPGLCFQMKALKTELVSGVVLDALYQEVRVQAAGRMPLIVNHRVGYGNPLNWWLWIGADHFVHVMTTAPTWMMPADGGELIRVRLGYALPMLKSFSDRLEAK